MILPSKSTTTHIETNFDDTGRAEAEAFLSEIEGDGAKAGEVFAEVAAKAESANTSSGELASRVKALEDSRLDEQAVRNEIERVKNQRTIWWDGNGAMPQPPTDGAVVDLSTGKIWGP